MDNIITFGEKARAGKRTVDKDESKRMGDLIRKYRLQAGLEQKQVGAALGYSTTAIGSWELGISRPNLDVLGPLCDMLNIPIDEFLGISAYSILAGDDKNLLNRYHSLSPFNQQTIDIMMDRLLFQQNKEEQARLRKKYTTITCYESSAAAGIGSPLPDYEEKQNVYVKKQNIPFGTTCIIKVNGASMKPRFPDGCCVYVDTDAEVSFGEVGIFIVDGESYIKELRQEGLHSYNPCYKTIQIHEDTDCRCFGKVLGVVAKDDFPEASDIDKILEAFSEE